MTRAISGAQILEEWKGTDTSDVLYKRCCDNCGYFPLHPSISVRMAPHGNVAYGYYHAESFICPFCGNHQIVKLER
jgi:hypothetical protein